MAERIKPTKMKVTHVSLQEKGDNPETRVMSDHVVHGSVAGRLSRQHPDTGKRRQRGDIDDGFGQPILLLPFGGCQLSYRRKDNQGIEHRKYYIGYVQFAFVRSSANGFIVNLIGQDDAPGGESFTTEKQVEAYLREQLVAA